MLVSAAKQKNKKRQNISLPITVRRHHGLGPRRPLARAPLRYDVGDEVDVAVDGTVNVYPYDKGWKRGVILFKFCSVEEEHVRAVLPRSYLQRLPPDVQIAYLVKLNGDDGYAPAHFNDPDFIRATDAKYANDAPTRFAVGDEVQCQVGENV